MEIKLSIPVQAIPLNMIYSTLKNGRRVKSAKYRAFSKEVGLYLALKNKALLGFAAAFDENKHYVMCDWKFYRPIFTKDNRISKNSGDSSNMIKPIEDIVFKAMGVNDAFVIGGSFIKINSGKPRIEVNIRLCELGGIL